MVFLSYEPTNPLVSHHSVHLHGQNFAILKIGYPEYNHTTGRAIAMNGDIQCDGDMCMSPSWTDGKGPRDLNVVTPPMKDTVVVPARGYVVVEIRTLNPGYWMLHCHQEMHLEQGMVMLLNVSGYNTPPLPWLPEHAPICQHVGTDRRRVADMSATPQQETHGQAL